MGCSNFDAQHYKWGGMKKIIWIVLCCLALTANSQAALPEPKEDLILK